MCCCPAKDCLSLAFRCSVLAVSHLVNLARFDVAHTTFRVGAGDLSAGRAATALPLPLPLRRSEVLEGVLPSTLVAESTQLYRLSVGCVSGRCARLSS